MSYDLELYERVNAAESAQEILTQKVERLERALRELLHSVHTEPFHAAARARNVLNETFPI